MPADVNFVRLREITDPDRGITYGIVKIGDFVPDGVRVIRGGDIRDGRIEIDEDRCVSEEVSRRFRRTLLRGGEIVMNLIAEPGHSAVVPAALAGHNVTRDVAVIPLLDHVDHRWVYYYLRSPQCIEWLTSRLQGSVTQKINLGTLNELPVPLPPLTGQRAIAHILGSLDDKIELNRRMNETLEAMAQAIFKSWFVDFDPVRAKGAGRQPIGMDAETAALFPDSFEESELGEIPEGWRAGCVGDFVCQRSERLGNREAAVLSAVASGKLVRSDEHFKKRVYSRELAKYLVVEQWDFAYNPSRINIGSIGMHEQPILGAVSPVYVVLRPKTAYRWFLEFLLRRAHTKQWVETLASGSVRQSLSYTDFASVPCVVPPEPVALRFEEVWTGFRGAIEAREAESRTLAAIRDTLLPKLMSGEIRVGQ